jgi:methionine-rich copper-binding protein CopC
VTNGAPVASGGKLDTSTPGTYTFTVTATSSDGSTTTATATYTVKLAPPPKPSVGSIKASHKTFADGNKLAAIAKKHKKSPVGTTFSFKLNTTATLKLSFAEQLKGRKVKHKCVAQTSHNRHDRSCKLSKSAGTLTLSGHAGTDKVGFQGRVSKHKKLGAGTYVLTITASNASGKSRGRTVTFTIVR